jgi:hypothetical protein
LGHSLGPFLFLVNKFTRNPGVSKAVQKRTQMSYTNMHPVHRDRPGLARGGVTGTKGAAGPSARWVQGASGMALAASRLRVGSPGHATPGAAGGSRAAALSEVAWPPGRPAVGVHAHARQCQRAPATGTGHWHPAPHCHRDPMTATGRGAAPGKQGRHAQPGAYAHYHMHLGRGCWQTLRG